MNRASARCNLHPPMPIIVGVPRSGTTLLRLMLDAHPELAIPPETGFLRELIAGCDEPASALSASASAAGSSAEALAACITAAPEWRDFGLDAEQLHSALAAVAPFDLAEGLRAFYRLYAANCRKRRYGDKTPGYLACLPQLARLLPEAHFIHIYRDGRDVALSVRGLWFSPGSDMAALARDWQHRILRARAFAPECPHYLEVCYELLVQSPEAELRRICDYLQLEFAPQMLDYHQRAGERLAQHQDRYRADGTLLVSKAQRLYNQRYCCQPPQADRIGRWRREMTAQELAAFEAVAGELLEELGYTTARRPAAADSAAALPAAPALLPAVAAAAPQASPQAPLRILLTNKSLAGRGGTQLYVYDVATALLRRGHSPVVYSPVLGDVAQALRAATVPVVDDLRKIAAPIDVIHGQHTLETLAAMLHFPGVPGVYFCHGWNSWALAPLRFPRIRRFVAVDETCRDRLLLEHGIPAEQIDLVLNFVDLSRFHPRPPLRERPRRALAFGNDLRPADVELLRAACGARGIALRALGRQVGGEVQYPESVLGQYDLVFAKARCALEAMAVGAGVVLFGSHGVGPLITMQNFDRLRRQNFGVRAQQLPATREALLRQIDGYSAVDARAVSARVREEAGLEAAVDKLVEIYRRAIAAQREASPDAVSDARSAADYLRQIGPIFHTLPQVSREAEQLRREKAQLAAERDQLHGELARIRDLWPLRVSAPLRSFVRALRGGKRAA